MANKVQWQFEFVGLDAALAKLHEVDRTLTRIMGKNATLSGMTGGTAGGKTVIMPQGAAQGGVGGAEAITAAAAAGVGTKLGGLSAKPWEEAAKISEKGLLSVRTIFKNLEDMTQWSEKMDIAIKKGGSLFPESFKKQMDDIRASYDPLYVPKPQSPSYKGPVPPLIKTPPVVNLKNTLMGNFKEVLKTSGTGGNLTGLLTSFGKFGPLVAAAGAALLGLVTAAKLLKRGMEEGARVFQSAAASGAGVSKTYQIEQALRAIGINETPTYQMMLSDPRSMTGAARASGFGGAQQLQNMTEEFAKALKDAASSARQLELASKANQMLQISFVGIQREWNTLLIQASAALSPFIQSILDLTKGTIKLFNLYFELINKIKSMIPTWLGGIPSGSPGKEMWPGGKGGGGMPSITSWEKIGLSFGRGSQLSSIENNTKITADEMKASVTILGKILTVLSPGSATGAVAGNIGRFLP